ncbi:MAG: DUF4364 family protein [Ruminococcaceae bacterium]|nr:DUF4364 family protein [Oscillospiraceae bacterium]
MTRMGYIQNDLDLKLLVLYIINRAVAPITFNQLLELALCDAGVDYFSLTQAVNHLVETEHLTAQGDRYEITEKGRHNCKICEETLPFSVRRRCDENLVAVNEQLQREAQIRGKLIPREDGTFTVSLALDDDAGNLFQLELLIPSREQGEALISRFKANPEQFYNTLVCNVMIEQ